MVTIRDVQKLENDLEEARLALDELSREVDVYERSIAQDEIRMKKPDTSDRMIGEYEDSIRRDREKLEEYREKLEEAKLEYGRISSEVETAKADFIAPFIEAYESRR